MDRPKDPESAQQFEGHTKALEGATIDPREGSCGAAAYVGEPAIAVDIVTHLASVAG